MSPSTRITARAIAAGSLALATPLSAFAQDSNAKIEALEKRVAELEAKLPKDAVGSGGDTMKWSDFSALGSKFQLYGFLRLDAIYDDSRPSSVQLPAYVRSEDPAAPSGFKAPRNSSDFNMHPKLTRLGLNMTGPKIPGLGDAQTLGKLEVDFYNTIPASSSQTAGGTESRENVRIRVAYLQMKWTDCSLYAGQMWDVISPLYPIVNPDFVMWGAGNLGDRRPQLRGEWGHAVGADKLNVQLMAGATGADDAQDLDGNGYRDGDQSAIPTFQGRVGVKHPVADWKKDVDFGVWAHRGEERVDAPIGGGKRLMSSAYGVDLTVPLYQDKVWAKGEYWVGRNLDDVRGGILQGINANGKPIRSTGGFYELGVQATKEVSVYGGWSFDDPNNEDLTNSASNAGRASNHIYYAAIRFDYSPVSFGLDYLHWETAYKGFGDGVDNRLQAFIQYKF
jgi:hypothetical protein